ncbi:MAG: LacI family DNA-binding transcriptional regulator [Alphaproteobacteria bacterium]|jgi:LacI family transcriptional regulator, repressor for deo operon, udp, cdd, tsx, nupC, and nupG|nr:LacI family DNA-binding transcriptional regulator [Alphaproteobacteria bacterium]MBT5860991.1 LacI family DNA-binding transcriptional regulator [Alphaproteobacteria bacterium]
MADNTQVKNANGRGGDKPTTMADIARIAGVSTATVSRALANPAVVTAETREKIDRAVADADYRVNTLARNLRKMETRTILVIVPDIANPFFSDIFRGIEEVAHENGFVAVIGNTEVDPEREAAYANMARERRADGLLLLDGKLPAWASGASALGGVPFVMACEYVDGPDICLVRTDNYDAAKLAVAHLAELGHRRIAHIAGPLDRSISQDRMRGYHDGLAEAGLDDDPALIFEGDFGLDSGTAAIPTLMLGKPTAIFTSNDEMAMGAIQGLRAMGLGVPEDVSVVGFDDIRFAGAYNPPLTTVAQPRYEIGRLATEMLMQLLSGHELGQRQRVLNSSLVIRESSAPPAKAGG